jgi:hypothetical protein
MSDPTRARPFSVFLLKDGYDADNALASDHKLGDPVAATSLPSGSVLYIFDGLPREPWWKLYFGVPGKLIQSTKAAFSS